MPVRWRASGTEPKRWVALTANPPHRAYDHLRVGLTAHTLNRAGGSVRSMAAYRRMYNGMSSSRVYAR
jgi:hypothetical protein